MADSGSDDDNCQKKIALKFKTTSETHQIDVKENANILKIRRIVAEKLTQPVERICLIFSGKILKDHETLQHHGITDGLVIHVVVRQQANKPETHGTQNHGQTSHSVSTPGQNQQQLGAQQLLNNDLMRQIMNSPVMQSFFDDPDIIRSMFAQNPQIQQLIQSNPELGHFLNDPQIIRESMEIIRNPTRLNELMRSHDQAVRNLQGIPGGEAALQRLYQDVQEPLINSTIGSLNNNPYSTTQANQNEQANARSQRAGVENAEALPNPWGNIVNPPRANLSAEITRDQNQNNTSSNIQQGQIGIANLMNTPGMQSLFRQISSDPNLMQNIMSNENMQRLSNTLQTSGIIQQMVPGVDQTAVDQAMNMMSNPDMLRSFSNPRVLDALNKIREATQVLREEAPHLFQNIPGLLGGMIPNANFPSNPASTTPSQTQPFSTENPGQIQQPSNALPNGFMELMNQMMQLNPGNNLPPETRFRAQLDQLVSMGFTNHQQNIDALTATLGDVTAAIERLLSNNN